MNLSEIVSDFKQHFETAKTDAENFLTDHLPKLSALAEAAASNPVVEAILKAEHLSPVFLGALADVINKADAELAALQPAPAPAEAPAEPAAEPTA